MTSTFNPGYNTPIDTFGELLMRRSDDHDIGLRYEDQAWTWSEFVQESAMRSALFRCWASTLADRVSRRTDPIARSLHIGILLPNVPEYLFALSAAALSGVAVIGINPTRRGAELAADIRSVDCDVIITDAQGADLIDGLNTGVDELWIVRVDCQQWRDRVAEHVTAPVEMADDAKDPATLLALLFTSGSTGPPKAVICGTGRMAMLGQLNFRGLIKSDVAYSAMPLFHGNAVMAVFAPCVAVGCTFTMRHTFSASNFLSDVLKFSATYVNYVGRSLAYILDQPERPEEKQTKLRIVFGTEASARDRAEFERRFGVKPAEAYGCSEGAVVVSRSDDTPEDALGKPFTNMNIVLWNKEGQQCPPAEFDGDGVLTNADEAIGEIVNLTGAAMFEGYYRNPGATADRLVGQAYRSGDLAYTTADGNLYFAGRTGDWMRVDSENLSAGPIERILARFPGALVVAVYSVPDVRTGDQVMVAIEMEHEKKFDPVSFASFVHNEPDMGVKWVPRFVRIVNSMPTTATRKLAKQVLKQEAWNPSNGVFIRDVDGQYRPFTADDHAVREAAIRANRPNHGRL